MRAYSLLTWLAAYFLALLVAGSILRQKVAIDPPSRPLVVRSFWKDGKRVDRIVAEDPGKIQKRDDGATAVDEVVTGESPMAHGKLTMPFSLVAGRDGVAATVDGKTAYATADDLLAAQAYDHATTFFDASFGIGTHRPTVLHILATDLGTTVEDVEYHAEFKRIRFEKKPPPPIVEVTPERVLFALKQAASYLARTVDANGKFRYIVDAPTNNTLNSSYNWPRHSGATYFLAQAAKLFDDPEVRYAALRAASQLRDVKMTTCGKEKCIADEDDVDVGSNALALVAFSEIVTTGADPAYEVAVKDLASFLRSQQRADGEFMHLYDRAKGQPIDVQYMYYTGEAALGLSRAHRVTHDPRDLEAAKKALAHLSGAGWSFFGSRYYYGEEHWTCQSAADLWDRAPNEEALGFCLRWHQYQRRLQYDRGDSPYDADGAFGFGPVATPRVTPASSRGEAAGAALAVLLRTNTHAEERELLDVELRHAAAFVLRNQLVDGNATAAFHVFAAPDAVAGAFPGSAVDLQLRIDYVQHAGSMLIRWLEVSGLAH